MKKQKGRGWFHAVRYFLGRAAVIAIALLTVRGAGLVVEHFTINPLVAFAAGIPSLIAGFALAGLVHELGHLVAGLRAGMRFQRFFAGPFCIYRTNRGLKVYRSARAWLVSGVAMTLPENSDSTKALRKYFLGGSIATSMLALALGVVLAAAYRKVQGLEVVILGALFVAAVIVILGSAIPSSANGTMTDAAIFADLGKGGKKSALIKQYFLILGEISNGVRARNWSRAAVEALLADSSEGVGQLQALLLAYTYYRDVDEKSNWRTYLDRAEEIVSCLGSRSGIYADVLRLELAFVTADTDDDVLLAGELFSKSKSRAADLEYGRDIVLAAIRVAQGRIVEGEVALKKAKESLRTEQSRTGCNIERGTETIARLRQKLYNPDLQVRITSKIQTLEEISATPGSAVQV